MAADAYTVFFNRDELKTRTRALPPTITEQNGVRYIAPVDLDGGGTWIGTNEFGVTCGLLNNYYENVRSDAFKHKPPNKKLTPEGVTTNHESRGLLVTSLLDSLSPSVALAKLNGMHLSEFKPFLLALFAPDQPVVLCIWDGEALQIQHEKVGLPISSSSYDTHNVVRNRKQEFAQLESLNRHIDSTLLESYHASHSPKGGAYSVCMHRDDAETVSFSRIRVTRNQVEFCYTPSAPCATKERAVVTLNVIGLNNLQRKGNRNVIQTACLATCNEKGTAT
jgi:hypothetical protein